MLRWGRPFVAAVAHVFRGPTERFEAIDVVADQDLAEVHDMAAPGHQPPRRWHRRAGDHRHQGRHAIANCCNSLAEPGRVEVIAGISLPMLLRAITYRRDTLDVVVEMALAGAQSGAVRVDNRIRVGPA